MSAPLISYMMGCFNEEAFVERAILCAFEQTYSPLEIILSDNVSTDRTLVIMRNMAAAYEGPHDVRVIEQPEHCNICEHTNRMMKEVRGELVLQVCGDDLQDPQRTEKVAKVWQETGASLVANNLAKVNLDASEVLSMHRNPTEEHEVSLQEILRRVADNACTGAAQAWVPSLFHHYGPLPDWYHTSDLLLPFWAALEDGCAYIPEPLTYYRITGSNSGLGNQHILADETQKKVLEEKMAADVMAQLTCMQDCLSLLRRKEPDRLDFEECFDLLGESIIDAATKWSNAREYLVKLEQRSQSLVA